LTTSSASSYPGCVAINPFGNTIPQTGYNYITGTTWYDLTNRLDNVGGSISGDVFQLPAGPVTAALSGEARWLGYTVGSNFSPTATVNCTNLRNCSGNAPVWLGGVLAPVQASNNVWEFSGEANIPVVKNVPLIESFDVNVAGRYTNYSISGAVETWKVGLDWHINGDIRLRGTNSVDIRAPTLNDLFLPLSATQTGFQDLLTQVSSVTSVITQGNPKLMPEVARTYTGGIVLTPSFIPGLTASLDYYRIALKNAIGSISGTNTQIQNLCNASGGTSQYCTLYARPISATSTAPANYPTAVFSQNLNTALQRIEGLDFEVNYTLDASDIISGAPGSFSWRGMVNYQPMNETQQFPGAALTTTTAVTGQPEPKTHVTLFASYDVGDWKFAIQDHWFSGFNPSIQPGVIIWANPSHVESFNTVDINIDKTFDAAGGTFDAYFNVQNLGNEQPPIYTNTAGSIGLNYPTLRTEDRMGRYFTIGVRAKF
jgi:iron complex outermembrane receptor protein